MLEMLDEERIRDIVRDALNERAGRALFDHDFENAHRENVDAVMLAERHRAELDRATAEVEHDAAVVRLETAKMCRVATTFLLGTAIGFLCIEIVQAVAR